MGKYDPKEREKYWQNFWEENGVYRFDPESEKEVYSIDTPPPTISGKLHMGHVFSYTQTEIVARFRRMAGFNVYYPFGMDDNGLPTERLVEQELGIKGSSMNRSDFIAKCLERIGVYHQKYRDLWQSLGLSVDWRLEYSTISDPVRKLTQQNFIDFYNRGVIYRKQAPSLWCTICKTAVAQAEVEDQKIEGSLYEIAFLTEEEKKIVIATSRPELLPACVAVFVNPKDKKNSKLVGTTLTTPLGCKVKVFKDEKVKIGKGTGIVMCCTYGDETDLAWKHEFNLDEKIVLNKNGIFTKEANFDVVYGKSIKDARLEIVDWLRTNNFLVDEKMLSHDVGCHERCGTPIEIINTDQWFVRVLDIKDELIKMSTNINWYPKMMKNRYVEWVKNLKWDWSISRDRFFGIPAPAFICLRCGYINLADKSELPIDPLTDKKKRTCQKCQSNNLKGDSLVLDTWFTSGNTPEINTILNHKLTGQKIIIPLSLRPQAHDIIRTWAFYTTVFAYYKYKNIPWRDIAISGHILLRKGEKISKRTGGGKLRPEDQIAEHSADAIRYAMCGASLGVDAYYDNNEIENGKKLVNKLFNAGNFCVSALSGYVPENTHIDLEPLDQWIIFKSQLAAQKMADYFLKYDYSHARDLFIKFFWSDFCDNYLEIVKKRVYDLEPQDPKKLSVQKATFTTFLNIIKMVAPFLPHITEEIYQSYYRKFANYPMSVHVSAWPSKELNIKLKDWKQLDKLVTELISIVGITRKEKGRQKLGLSAEINKLEISHPWLLVKDLDCLIFDLKGATRANEIVIIEGDLSVKLIN